MPSIPRILHKVVFLTRFSHSPEVSDALRSWVIQNPLHEVRTYASEGAALDALRARGLNDVVLAIKQIKSLAMKVDVFRLGILWADGGWYSDWKQECLETGLLDRLAALSNHTYVACLDNGNDYSIAHGLYQNAFLGAPPRDPCIGYVLRATLRNVWKHYYGDTSLDATGPGVLGRVIRNRCRAPQIRCEHRDNLFYVDRDPIIRHKCSRCRKDQEWDGGNNYNKLWTSRRVYVEYPSPPPPPPPPPPPSPTLLLPRFIAISLLPPLMVMVFTTYLVLVMCMASFKRNTDNSKS